MSPTTAARTQRITRHLPLARAIACRVHRRVRGAAELDDMIAAGFEGLIEAVDRYDGSRGVSFKSFAQHRIQGSVVDWLRTNDWVPRASRRKAKHINGHRTCLEGRLGRPPTRDELRDALGVDREAYARMSDQAAQRAPLSLDAPISAEDNTPLVEQVADAGDLEQTVVHNDLSAQVIALISGLPERERTAVALYYLHELNLKEVGEVLGVSESRACQLRAKGIYRLRRRI